TPHFQRNDEELPVSVDKLRQLIEDKVNILQLPAAEDQQGLVLEENPGEEELLRFTALSQELTFHLQQLQRRTEQELRNIQTHEDELKHIEVWQQMHTHTLNLIIFQEDF
ncbi:hypothetical protein ILYODFUR_012870, partial [Ilyodon furcidens]